MKNMLGGHGKYVPNMLGRLRVNMFPTILYGHYNKKDKKSTKKL